MISPFANRCLHHPFLRAKSSELSSRRRIVIARVHLSVATLRVGRAAPPRFQKHAAGSLYRAVNDLHPRVHFRDYVTMGIARRGRSYGLSTRPAG